MEFQILASIIGILGGLLAIVFRERLAKAQARYFSSQIDQLNRQMGEILSRPETKNLIVFISIFIILICILTLADIYNLIMLP